MNLGVIIAAGGFGSRMGAGMSKQLMLLVGQPVVARSTAIFEAVAEVGEIVIVIDPADVKNCREQVVEKYELAKVRAVVAGGESRARSVLNGLAELSPDVDTVLVHDGARPLFPVSLLAPGIREYENGDCDGIVFGIPVTDTIKELASEGGLIGRTPDRSLLWAAQTPQIFSRAILDKAYGQAPDILASSTDDASLVELAGGRVRMAIGSPENIKITSPVDLALAEEIIRRRGNKA
ncbi:MAG: 2-C-methyl-D-erythritol 4-phosphate cytidylyltransferase [Thermoleophilia bacterium]|nr:2-C-methyl-D-erythritol 4-phosphate cytidylyltransferase [Thermoleophilia bacterium]